MSVISFSLPIALVALLAVVLLAVYVMKKYFSAKITHWLLLVYIGVLLLSMVVVLLGTERESITLNTMNEAKENEIRKASNEFSKAIENKEKPKVDSKYIADKESLVFDETSLTIDTDWEQGVHVFVKRNPKSSKVEAQIYSFSTYTSDGYDFSDMIPPPEIKRDANKLFISGPGFREVEISIAMNEFPISQFESDKRSNLNIGSSSHWESFSIYLQVPEGVEIKAAENVYVEYLN